MQFKVKLPKYKKKYTERYYIHSKKKNYKKLEKNKYTNIYQKYKNPPPYDTSQYVNLPICELSPAR